MYFLQVSKPFSINSFFFSSVSNKKSFNAFSIPSFEISHLILLVSFRKSPNPSTCEDIKIDFDAKASKATIPKGSCLLGTITASAASNTSIFS